MKVAHLTSVHPRHDTRIFIKQCVSLSKTHAVSLVVADGKGNEIKVGVSIYDVGKSQGRFGRIVKTTRNVLHKALELDADIYHLHDPELLLIANKLRRHGKKVVFDAHEDLPKQILSKPYLRPWLARLLSCVISCYERWVCKKLDGIVAATPFIKQKFIKINQNTVDVNNYPLLKELMVDGSCWESKKKQVCYVGGITEIRGIFYVLKALEYMDGKRLSEKVMELVGTFSEKRTLLRAEMKAGFNRVEHRGFLNRAQVREVLRSSIAGVVTFLPVPNHIESQPNKMFEYMSAGIPVIASHFPLWKDIIEGNQCGICVDPENPSKISEAISYLLNNCKVAKAMGERGRKAVEEQYNWDSEFKKLQQFYQGL
jgi:glycosyltransferase involved in cell wall biosynthesis